MQGKDVTQEIREITDSFRDAITSSVQGTYGIAVSGSIGKGTNDGSSDYDFRLYYEEQADNFAVSWKEVQEKIAWWADRGRIIDGVWARKIADIDTELKAWYAGEGKPWDLDWAIWGYYLPTDIFCQKIIEDPYGILKRWKDELDSYPATLKEGIIRKYLNFLRYWREDYHYKHKIDMGDVVFSFSLAAKIIHAAVQIVFAVNERYYVGDGKNLEFTAEMDLVPEGFAERISSILYGAGSATDLPSQHAKVIELIDSVELLVKDNETDESGRNNE